jgi:hypothetical protein
VSAERVVDFELILPLNLGTDSPRATHVVVLCGDHQAFLGGLRELVDQGSPLARALCAGVGTISLGALADGLNELGHATVQSIDRL